MPPEPTPPEPTPLETMPIAQLTAAEVAARVQSGRLTSQTVVADCLERIDRYQPQLNALAVPLPRRAVEKASDVDGRHHAGQPLGRLAGVPVTIKECVQLTGTPHSLGRRSAQDRLADSSCPLVQRLEKADAVIVGKGNLSQLMLMHETDNPLYGRSNNPWNLERSCGGSSGGDAASVAAGFAHLALATDVGGSIRHPAHSCGIVGFKPTSRALDNAGVAPIYEGLPFYLQPGVMTRCVADARLALDVLGLASGDGRCRTDPAPDRPLRVGYWTTDSFFPTCPTGQRAVAQTAARLEARGIDVIPFEPPDMRAVFRLYCGIFSADGGAQVRRRLQGERIDPRIRRLLIVGRLPRWVRGLLATMVGDRYLADLLRHCGAGSAELLFQRQEKARELTVEFLARIRNLRLDAVLLPPSAAAALRHGCSGDLLPANTSLFLANLLDLPAGVVPVTRVAEDEQSWTPATRRSTAAERAALRNADGSAGLPYGVQVLGAPGEDQKVLAVMEHIEQACQDDSRRPVTPVTGEREAATLTPPHVARLSDTWPPGELSLI